MFRLISWLIVALVLVACGGPSPSKEVRTVNYCGPLKMEIHGPQSVGRPAVLYVHGGGWESGDRTSGFERRMIAPLNAAGIVVTTIDYRLAPRNRHPAQIRDVICALRYMSTNAGALGIDADRIGIMGDSAGGHLAALAALSAPSDTFGGPIPGGAVDIKAAATFYGIFDLVNVEPSLARQPVSQNFPTLAAKQNASPVLRVGPDDPPFLLVHGRNDRFVDIAQSVKLAKILQNAGHEPLLAVIENADHGFFPRGGTPSPDMATITRLLVAFFSDNL